jgi:hypothetical protein
MFLVYVDENGRSVETVNDRHKIAMTVERIRGEKRPKTSKNEYKKMFENVPQLHR